jgi:hypothetical protein
MRSTPTRLPDRVKAALWASSLAGLAAGAMMAAVSLSSSALAENIHGAATGPTTAPGFSHPEQYIHLKDVKPADNMYPVIQHPRAGQGGARVQMDYVLGKLVDKLAEIGELDNTLIIFTSDNGPECEPAIDALEARQRLLGHEHDDHSAGLHPELKAERA